MTDQCPDTTKAQFGEPVSSTEVTYRIRYDSDNSTTKAPPSMGDIPQMLGSGAAHCLVYKAAQQVGGSRKQGPQLV